LGFRSDVVKQLTVTTSYVEFHVTGSEGGGEETTG
jgi:hypothetical protein